MLFADDTTLLAAGKDPAETSEILNRDLQKISDWAETWKVQFNPKKSKDMIFSNKRLNKLGLSCAKLSLASAKLHTSLSSDQLKLATN